MNQVYTYTLSSGYQLVVQPRVDFGEAMITAILLAVFAVLVLRFAYRLIYRR